jgi:hypothetical protein
VPAGTQPAGTENGCYVTYALAGILHNLAYVDLQGGHCENAAAMLTEALRIHQSLDRELGIVQNLVGLGALACDSERFELAARLFGAAEAWRERLGQSADPFDRIELATGNVERLHSARAALGETFDGAWAAGRALSRRRLGIRHAGSARR